MLVESTRRKRFLDVRTRRLYILLFSVPCDNRNNKDVLSLRDVQLSLHKDAHNSDSEDYDDIGLSSEEEAGEMEDTPAIRRKYNKPTPPPLPVPPVPLPEPGTSAQQPSSDKVEVSKQVLEQAFSVLGQILKGEAPAVPTRSTGSQANPVLNPFKVYRAKEGERACSVCGRTFWKTMTLRRHQKTHVGTQKWTCKRDNCGRKLANKEVLTSINCLVVWKRGSFVGWKAVTVLLPPRRCCRCMAGFIGDSCPKHRGFVRAVRNLVSPDRSP